MADSRSPSPGRQLYAFHSANVYLRPMGGELAFNIWLRPLGGDGYIHINNPDAIAENAIKTLMMVSINPLDDPALYGTAFLQSRGVWLCQQLSGLLAVVDNRGVYQFLSRERSQALTATGTQLASGQGGSA